MKIIINASSLRATGASQVTISLIRELIQIDQHEYYLFLSNVIAEQLTNIHFPSNFKIYKFTNKPFFNLKGICSWKRLVKLEKEINPDCTFTVFGPSLWKPKSPHIVGFAYAYYIYTESPFFNIISLKRKIFINFLKKYHAFFFKRSEGYYVCETEDVAKRLPNYLKCNPSIVYTVSNTYNDFYTYFLNSSIINRLPEKAENEFRFVSLSSFAQHKNLKVLNDVIPIIKKGLRNLKLLFILSIDKDIVRANFNEDLHENIVCLGRLHAEDCPQIYFESDALFMPTLMECFSASYAEAMKMQKPIVTSDLPFAHVVCKDAALYFDPTDPYDIADKLITLITDKRLYNQLILNGNKVISTFNTPKQRAEKYIELCEKIAKES